MFEGILATILNKYLSEYIDEVDYNNLKLGLFSGTLELSNIKIKKSALYQFDLPIEVKCGKIGKLKINISWKNILTKPAVAEIEDLFVLLGPFEENINNPKRIEEIIQAHKRKLLQESEKIDKAEIYDNKEKGFAEKVQDTIINNIQIYLRNVHIRYEDKFSIKNNVISFGIFLSEFKAETVDAAGKPNFLNADEKIIFKIGSLTGFNLYWNSADSIDKLISTNPELKKDNEFCWKLLKESIYSSKIINSTFNTFMKENLDLKTRLTLRRSYQKEEMHLPKITFQSSISAIEFIFMRAQYKTILEVFDYYTLLNIHKKYVKYRPSETSDRKLRVKLWWRYGFTALAETTWRSYRKERMLGHWRNYKLYLKMYEKKLELGMKSKELDTKEKNYVELLEQGLLLDSIIDARALCTEKIVPPKAIANSIAGIAQDFTDRPNTYVEFRLILYFPLISLRLRNGGYDILKIDFRNIASRLEMRPVINSVYFVLNTRGVDIFGVYYKDDIKSGSNTLVPVVRSMNSNGVNLDDKQAFDGSRSSEDEANMAKLVSEDARNMLFTFCFETNPIKIENVEFSIRARFSQAEIFYEKTAITELLRFFKTDLIDFDEVKKIKEVWSKAGVIYAVEKHKQFHVSAELASPFFIVPMKGTCTEKGTSIVFFLGKTVIQSKVQPKLPTNYTPTSIQDLETHFYDQLSLSVNDVQIILVPNNVNWKEYLSNSAQLNYKYHLLYPVTTNNNLFLSINPSYKKLPKLKLNAECSSIRLNFSDNKILKLYEFSQKFPLPEIPKTSAPTSAIAIKPAAPATNNAMPNKKPTNETQSDSKLPFFTIDTAQITPEPDDEWEGPFMLATQINGDPIPNYCQILLRLDVDTFGIDLNSTEEFLKEDDPVNEIEYLKFLLNEIRVDFAITKFGFSFRAGLGNLKLIDKIHSTENNRETEILSSLSSQKIINFYLRQVEETAPNFASLYNKILCNILFDCSNIRIACHRTVIVYFLNYAKRIVDNITIETKTPSNAITDVSNEDNSKDLITSINQKKFNDEICELNVIAKMSGLTWDMFDTNLRFGNMVVKNLKINYNLRGIRTELSAQLREILINYSDVDNTINDAYEQIIQCKAEGNAKQFFDFNLVLYNLTKVESEFEREKLRDSVNLYVGKIKLICLVKFVNELVNFMEPIINPLPTLTEQVKDQAYEVMKSAYQEQEISGKKIFLNIHVASPQVIIPQNSSSLSGFLIDLGNLNIKNSYKNEPVIDNALMSTSLIDEISLSLENMEVKRILYQKNSVDFYKIKEQVVHPISLISKIRRTVKNFEPQRLPDMKIFAQINNMDCTISLKSAKLIFAILNENLNEGIQREKPKKDTTEAEINTIFDEVDEGTAETNSQALEQKETPSKAKSTKKNERIDRINLKIQLELSKIKVVIVEIRKKPTGALIKEEAASLKDQKGISSSPSFDKSIGHPLFASKFTNFGLLEIEDILLDFSSNENTSWKANLKLRALNVNDLRPDSNLAVKEMFIPTCKEKFFIEMIYSSDPVEFEKLEFALDHIRINLCLPYILKLYQFAMEAINTSPAPNQAANTTYNTTIVSSNSNKPAEIISTEQNTFKQASSKSRKSIFPTNQNGNPDAEIAINKGVTKVSEINKKLSVLGRVNLPDVVLFAEPEKFNSKVLNMNAVLQISFESEKGATSLEINLLEMGIRLGEFNNSKRQGIPFLSPCSAFVTMKQSAPNVLARYSASIDSLYFNMTATLYEVVMGVINTINKTGTESVYKESEIKKQLEESEPFVHYDIDSRAYLLAKTNNSTEKESVDANLSPEQIKMELQDELKEKKRLLEILDLTIVGAYITFCEESGIDLQPLAIIKLELNGRVSNWTKDLHTKASLSIEASYYNDHLSTWEPLIENVKQTEDIYRPWVLSLWFAIDVGGVLQPPIDNQGIVTVQFPVVDLDYSMIEDEEQQDLNPTQQAQVSVSVAAAPANSTDFNNTVETHFIQNLANAKTKKDSKPDEEEEEDDQGDVDQTDEVEPQITEQKANFILVESNDLLNINITPSAYKVIMYLTHITSGSDKDFVESKDKPPLKFLNFIGEPGDLILSTSIHQLQPEHAIGFNLKFVQSSRQSANKTSMTNALLSAANQDNITQIALTSHRSQINTVYNENYKFQLILDGFETCRLSMKSDGSFLFQLKRLEPKQALSNEEGDEAEIYNKTQLQPKMSQDYSDSMKYNAMFKVRTLYGRTKLIFSSPLQIENNTQLKLLIMVELTEKNRLKLHVLEEIQVKEKTYAVIFHLLPSKIYYVPLYVAYSCKLYTTLDELKNSSAPPGQIFDIRGYNLRLNEIEEISFVNESGEDFQLIRTLNLNVRSHKNVMPQMHANYKVSIYSPIKILNCLPIAIRLDISDKDEDKLLLNPGEVLNSHLNRIKLSMCKINVVDYLNTNWVGVIDWNELTKEDGKTDVLKLELTVSPTTEMCISGKHLTLYISYKRPNEFMLYSPYWLVNKSGQQIKIRACDNLRVFDIPDDSILLFDYKIINKNNKVRMSVKNNRWSNPFSLEAVGTTGMIQCKDDNRTYNFLMRITMSNSSRAKLITFAPFLSVVNQSDDLVFIREWHRNEKIVSNFDWRAVETVNVESKPISFWPNYAGESKHVCFVIKTKNGFESQPFPLENPGRFVLTMKPKVASKQRTKIVGSKTSDLSAGSSAESSQILTVLISGGSQNPVTIILRKYQYGDSVAKLVNLCDNLSITMKQKYVDVGWKLNPLKSMFFVWPEFIKNSRELYWTVNSAMSSSYEPLGLSRSGIDCVIFNVDRNTSMRQNSENDHHDASMDTKNLLAPSPSGSLHDQKVKIYCVSYIDSTQRVVVFTTDPSLAQVERKKEASTMEIFINLKGMLISVINNVNLEIATISIKDSCSIWSLENNNETKLFTNEYSEWLEKIYNQYLFSRNTTFANRFLKSTEIVMFDTARPQSTVSGGAAKKVAANKVDIDFKRMKMLRPEKGSLKRIWQPGLFVQYRVSTNMMSLKSCIYNLQIDNQLPDAYFPISFYKSPIKNNSDDLISLPFMTFCLFTEQQEVTQIYRCFDCALQEFYLKIDKGFGLSLIDWYNSSTVTVTKNDKNFDLSDENSREAINIYFNLDQDKSIREKMDMDITLTKEIMEYVNQAGDVKQSAHIHFDDVHLSPIQVLH